MRNHLGQLGVPVVVLRQDQLELLFQLALVLMTHPMGSARPGVGRTLGLGWHPPLSATVGNATRNARSAWAPARWMWRAPVEGSRYSSSVTWRVGMGWVRNSSNVLIVTRDGAPAAEAAGDWFRRPAAVAAGRLRRARRTICPARDRHDCAGGRDDHLPDNALPAD